MLNDEELLKVVIRRLVNRFKVKAVVLFGSRARGDWGPWSDYDLLVIAEFISPYLERIKEVLDLLGDIPLNIEPHPYTLEETIDMLKRGNPTIVNALEEGKILYKNKDFEKISEILKELKKKGLRRSKTSIILPIKEDFFFGQF